MKTKRLLKLKHDRHDLGFFGARIDKEEGGFASWSLRVESPAETDEFLDHLAAGSPMDFTMVTREGEFLAGEAYVASVSDCYDAATIVLLSGSGPLQRA